MENLQEVELIKNSETYRRVDRVDDTREVNCKDK